jgi:hypothetical protein
MTKYNDSEVTEHGHFCYDSTQYKPGQCVVKQKIHFPPDFTCQCFGLDFTIRASPVWCEGMQKMSLTEMLDEIKTYRKRQSELTKAYYQSRGIKPQKYNGYAMNKAMQGKPLICVVCGDKRKHLLQRHHKDNNPDNNDTDNLEWQCIKCHTKGRGWDGL